MTEWSFTQVSKLTRIRSDVDLVHPGWAPTGAGLPPTYAQLYWLCVLEQFSNVLLDEGYYGLIVTGLKCTFRWSDLNLLMRLLLPTLGMPTTSKVLSGRSARCHLKNYVSSKRSFLGADLSSPPTSLEAVGMMAAVCGQ